MVVEDGDSWWKYPNIGPGMDSQWTYTSNIQALLRRDLLTIAAHEQDETIHLARFYPDHTPRADDPNYHLFEQAKARLKQQGLWKCVIATEDCSGPISLHHSHFEFAYANVIDVTKVNEMLGLELDDTDFQRWIEQPGNLEPLCFAHHMGLLAIHRIPSADWDTVRAHKVGLHPIQVTHPTGAHLVES